MNVTSAASSSEPLRHLAPGWFAIVMGWTGLALAWHRAGGLMGEAAGVVSALAAVVAALVCTALLLASLWRQQRHPLAVHEDLQHPVRHAFFAAVPISLLLLATAAVAHGLDGALVRGLWAVAALAEGAITVWVLARWLRADGKGLVWAGVTPVLFIPVVGNVIVPLAGVPLGYADWSAAQFGVGLFFWPVVLTLLAVRLGTAGLWPERLLPTSFITVAPPAVVGLSLLQLGAAPAYGWATWGIALFFLLWSASVVRRLLAQPFAVPFWGLSFPLAAFAALTLRLADGPVTRLLALAALALATLVILALSIATVKGLVRGTLLVPEPAPAIPIAPAVPAAPRA